MEHNPVLMQLLPLIPIVIIFYFLLIRPQNKQMKETKAMLAALKAGDRVLTRGGLIGSITGVKEHEVELEIAKGVKASFARTSVAMVLTQGKDLSAADGQA